MKTPGEQGMEEQGTTALPEQRIAVLHLRMATAAGGGPEKTLLVTGKLTDRERFDYLAVYLRRRRSRPAAVLEQARACGLDFRDFPGPAPLQLVRTCRLIRERSVRILHCHEPRSDVYGILLKRIFPSLHLVSTMHGWIERTRSKGLLNRLDLWALRHFDCVIAVSEAVQEIARRSGVRRTELIRNAIDTEEWRPRGPESGGGSSRQGPTPFRVGFVGRISREKGPLDFVRVAAAVLERNGGWEFDVAGDGPQSEEMRSLVEHLGLTSHFRFRGTLRESQLRDFYQGLDALLSPSHTEGLPNTVLEAGALGVPVVATRVGGVGEIISHAENGLLADLGDITALAAALQLLRGDAALGRRLSAAGRRVVEERFCMARRVRTEEALYLRLLQSAAG